jgi:UDP-N-acetylglucosamine 3-dehydrogenase
VELVALCDSDRDLVARSAAEERMVFDADEIVGDDSIDVLDICLPHHLHAPLAIRALEADHHILIEKPMAMTVDECDQINTVAERARRTVGVSHNQLFYEPHQRLISMIKQGELGEIQTVRARLAIGGKYGSWRSDPVKAGGGLLMDAGVHRAYLIEALGGPVRSIVATMDRPRAEDRFSLVVEFESGAIGTVDATYHGPEGMFDDQVEVVGTSGAARVAGCEALFEGFSSEPPISVWRNGAWDHTSSQDDWVSSVSNSIEAFLAAVEAGVSPPVSGGDGRRTVSLIQAAYESAETGHRVELAG